MSSKVLDVKDLCKTYVIDEFSNNVLQNVSFSMEEGEFVSIMGPSGSGKSTLLYTVSGMDDMTSGSVSFDGEDISDLDRKSMAKVRLNKMGFVFQQMYMMKKLNILDNIILPGYQAKLKSRSEVNKDAEALMRRLGIIETADRYITEVSGGQLQRACLCRSLINNPKMIFADEPTGALNRTSSDEVMEELTKLNDGGTTVMLVTHDAKVAAKCTRVLFIVDGNIKGEYNINKSDNIRDRERGLNNWLMEMGW